MPEPLIHFAVPFSILVAKGVDSKRALLLSFIALLPDLDVLLHVHRSWTHSMLIPLAVLATAVLIRRRCSKWLVVALLAYISHLVLDLFTAYTPILWPLYEWPLWLKVSLNVRVASLPMDVKLVVELLREPTSTTFAYLDVVEGEVMTGEGLLISSALIVAPLVARLRRAEALAGPGGLEPPTPGSGGRCSTPS